MSDRHFKDILTRTCDDVGLDRDVVETICKCFLYELAEEMAQRTVELPYIGDLSLRNKKIEPNKILKSLKAQGGSYAYKFKQQHAKLVKRSSIKRTRSVDSSERQGVDGGLPSDSETN